MNAETEAVAQHRTMLLGIVSGDLEKLLIHDTDNDWAFSRCRDAEYGASYVRQDPRLSEGTAPKENRGPVGGR